MTQINKMDFFVGAFISKILSKSKSVPALFNETDESKKIEFETNNDSYNVYVKYSTKRNVKPASRDGKRKEIVYWYINFTENEFDVFKKFFQEGKNNCISIICSNTKLLDTWIAVFDYEKALKCLDKQTSSKIRRIKVSRVGKAQEFLLSGVGFTKNDDLTCPFDYSSYFSNKK